MSATQFNKHIIIVGAGPGGLAAAMLLAKQGFQVDLYEKANQVGGRNAEIRLGDFTFDTGPTFFILPGILEELFREVGKDLNDYAKVIRLDPMYRLLFNDAQLDVSTDPAKMTAEIERVFPGSGPAYERFMRSEKKRFDHIFPLLQKKYTKWTDLLDLRILKAVPYAAFGKTLIDVLASYFKDERLQLSFSFQSKYLGMSPWKCPGLFAILPYIEHRYGVYHVEGGLTKLSQAMAKAAQELGVTIHLNSPVEQILVDRGVATGVRVHGQDYPADRVIVNADFSYATQQLFPAGTIKKWKPAKLEEASYSCSTFMLYLGLNRQYDLPHNTIIFSKDYKTYVDQLANAGKLTDDLSVYVCNNVQTDTTMAPTGQSALYVLVPVPNNRSGIQWDQEAPRLREVVLDLLEQRAGLTGIRQAIVEERVTTPDHWEHDYNVYLGAVFNLGHQFNQMLYWRPRNKFEEVNNCYLVGGGTHPGSGLPTIYESGRMTAHLIAAEYGEPYQEPHSLPTLR